MKKVMPISLIVILAGCGAATSHNKRTPEKNSEAAAPDEVKAAPDEATEEMVEFAAAGQYWGNTISQQATMDPVPGGPQAPPGEDWSNTIWQQATLDPVAPVSQAPVPPVSQAPVKRTISYYRFIFPNKFDGCPAPESISLYTWLDKEQRTTKRSFALRLGTAMIQGGGTGRYLFYDDLVGSDLDFVLRFPDTSVGGKRISHILANPDRPHILLARGGNRVNLVGTCK